MQNSKRMMVAGNWKMNGNLEMLNHFKSSLPVFENIDVVLCVPAVYIGEATGANFSVGAQDCSEHESGAHTGDISLAMLTELGAEHVIIGHSERRQRYDETNEQVAIKAKVALEKGFTPIVCLGETLDIRESGNVFEFVGEQLAAILRHCKQHLDRLVIAYEPVWAIGTGKTASPEQAQDVHAFIRSELKKSSELYSHICILYGGSVTDVNAAELFAQQDIDGALVGGASLKVDSFKIICEQANKRN